uniref:Uncharacterized protein n=1 Tax=Rhizophora mucronata TaxID=61149 RepID=A0A2P2KMJ3_RHIMU
MATILAKIASSSSSAAAAAAPTKQILSSSFYRLLFSVNFQRSFSASPTPATASSDFTSAASKKPKRKKKKNLFEVAQFLPNWGIGFHMAKSHWTNVSYELTKINLYKDGRHGKAWGIAYKDGQCVT